MIVPHWDFDAASEDTEDGEVRSDGNEGEELLDRKCSLVFGVYDDEDAMLPKSWGSNALTELRRRSVWLDPVVVSWGQDDDSSLVDRDEAIELLLQLENGSVRKGVELLHRLGRGEGSTEDKLLASKTSADGGAYDLPGERADADAVQ